MSTALHRFVPDKLDVIGNVVTALLVGATIYVLDGSLGNAAGSAVLFLALEISTDIADAVVGDYAGNAVFGLLVLTAAGAFVSLTGAWWLGGCFALCGCWLLLDGVQHLRYGVSRDEVGVPYRHEGSALTGLSRALLTRLLEPFLLSSRR
ncbi:hypothetical protein [Haloarcula salinisoli]|uniref:Uncharacterized protein n=1 Tax=Haloarcula salinisoli TaxID=2487746 RepID=A0A8J7YF98_9EURY|nr:hypothetical protein [Halomicroarcula salinisoli]MBX0287084.1 hypothetical protein [Halomicroarcula salinisoli]MBX0304387.1 hypothetical protein [Halomicroarcula salinisoli]